MAVCFYFVTLNHAKISIDYSNIGRAHHFARDYVLIDSAKSRKIFMEFSSSKRREVKPRVALVQGESFRCVAVETTLGRWMKVQDGSELPHVLEIVQVMEVGRSSGERMK
jgi:hypothetical protein